MDMLSMMMARAEQNQREIALPSVSAQEWRASKQKLLREPCKCLLLDPFSKTMQATEIRRVEEEEGAPTQCSWEDVKRVLGAEQMCTMSIQLQQGVVLTLYHHEFDGDLPHWPGAAIGACVPLIGKMLVVRSAILPCDGSRRMRMRQLHMHVQLDEPHERQLARMLRWLSASESISAQVEDHRLKLAARREQARDDPSVTVVDLGTGFHLTKCAHCGSQQQQGGEKLKWCSRCRTVAYCSTQCQHTDWKRHSPGCKAPQ